MRCSPLLWCLDQLITDKETAEYVNQSRLNFEEVLVLCAHETLCFWDLLLPLVNLKWTTLQLWTDALPLDRLCLNMAQRFFTKGVNTPQFEWTAQDMLCVNASLVSEVWFSYVKYRKQTNGFEIFKQTSCGPFAAFLCIIYRLFCMIWNSRIWNSTHTVSV